MALDVTTFHQRRRERAESALSLRADPFCPMSVLSGVLGQNADLSDGLDKLTYPDR